MEYGRIFSMRVSPLYSRTTLSLSVLLLCASVPLFTQTAVAERNSVNDFIQTVTRGGSSKITNQHPLKIKPARLTKILEQLRVVPRSKTRKAKKAIPLFSAEIAEQLGNNLAENFRQAKPDEDIMFQVTDSTPLFGELLDRDVLNNGLVFRHRDYLHIIFGAIHHRSQKRWVYGRVTHTINPPTLPTRDQVASLEYQIVPQPGIHFIKTRSGKERRDWIKIDLRKIGRDLSPDTKRAETKTRPKQMTTSIEARLSKLKKLYNEGLISERQYHTRVDKILDEL